MKTYQRTLNFHQSSRGTYNITTNINEVVKQSGIKTGLCQAFIQHTSASLMITENADPLVREDIETWMQTHVKDGDPAYKHDYEGPDDMSAHLRTLLTQTSQTLPVTNGHLNLGTWQGIFLYEHRTGVFSRHVVVTVQGEA
ncbi:secondary thiamine-phosphate synthase enzyme YjbQ [Thiomicrospira sp. WB1]|uniref:secondary thiamine-phosphate synthase enzyme YjbQ n=1 Tax=Thiomicrospira sp. WB1 TaxID=1685380 RepID=UPI0007466DE2|nr:secondary thiamine-phosphate synthase enzyme YjbQ [Thiomicrospira sp. WB1]KUJ72276.1 secondary thiamine-phosphate synthase [Thiomicrospira sp. WB1]